MLQDVVPGLPGLLRRQPKLRIDSSSTEDRIVLFGQYEFRASFRDSGEIEDSYKLEIKCLTPFPARLPLVSEVGERIPKTEQFHVNPDGTLCLGTELRQRARIGRRPNIVTFSDKCITPFLYAISYKKIHGKFPWGELDHGLPGLIMDYSSFFGLTKPRQVIQALYILGRRPRQANKLQCPCDCGHRYGVCSYKWHLEPHRKIASRKWFRTHALEIEHQYDHRRRLILSSGIVF